MIRELYHFDTLFDHLFCHFNLILLKEQIYELAQG